MLPHLATFAVLPLVVTVLPCRARCTFGAAGCVRRLPCYAVCTIGGYCDLTDLANRTVVACPKARGIAKLPRKTWQTEWACLLVLVPTRRTIMADGTIFPAQIFGPAALRARVAAAHASCNVGHIEVASGA